MPHQQDLFCTGTRLPEGFRYAPELIDTKAERDLLTRIPELELREFEFHGFTGKRRIASFGWRYDFNERRLERAVDVPDFLLALRETAAAFAGVRASDLQQVLVTEYAPGAGIGWHRDKPMFGDVVGSLCSTLAPFG